MGNDGDLRRSKEAVTERHDHGRTVLLVLFEDDGHLAVLAGDGVQLGAVTVQDQVAQLHELVVQGHTD